MTELLMDCHERELMKHDIINEVSHITKEEFEALSRIAYLLNRRAASK